MLTSIQSICRFCTGSDNGCARTSDNEVTCWGRDVFSESSITVSMYFLGIFTVVVWHNALPHAGMRTRSGGGTWPVQPVSGTLVQDLAGSLMRHEQ